ncbi:sulfurtransferase complex subunit TusD [Candidatus Pacearchaeota archaeon]|nr:sulfurtransferase complex subunit TusD [Candidatus Pacearchaeota archaeon]
MKFAIQINQSPYTHQSPDTAYQFTLAALKSGHEIYRIFFYHDGVLNGSGFTTPPQDERNVVARWSELAEEYGIDLVICIAAAQRRGIMDADEAERHGHAASNLAAGFRLSGLGQLIEAGIEADRLLVFGG